MERIHTDLFNTRVEQRHSGLFNTKSLFNTQWNEDTLVYSIRSGTNLLDLFNTRWDEDTHRFIRCKAGRRQSDFFNRELYFYQMYEQSFLKLILQLNVSVSYLLGLLVRIIHCRNGNLLSFVLKGLALSFFFLLGAKDLLREIKIGKGRVSIKNQHDL